MYHIIQPLFYSSLIENFCLKSYSPGLVHALKSYYVCVMSAENCLLLSLEVRERFPYLCMEHSLPKHTAFCSVHSSANKILIFSYWLTSNKMLVFLLSLHLCLIYVSRLILFNLDLTPFPTSSTAPPLVAPRVPSTFHWLFCSLTELHIVRVMTPLSCKGSSEPLKPELK